MEHVCCLIFGDIRFDSRSSKFLQALTASGYRTTAVMIPAPSNAAYPANVSIVPLNDRCTASLKYRLPLYYLRSLIAALRSRATIFLASELYSLPTAWLASLITGSKLVYDSRELYTAVAALHDRPFAQRFWAACERLLIRRSASVITVNDSIAGLLREAYKLQNVHVVRNIPEPPAGACRPVLRTRCNIPAQTKIVLYQGGLLKGRGVSLLLNITGQFSDIEFVFIGSGPLRSEILAAAESNRHIHHLDAVPRNELLSYTADADVGFCVIENLSLSYYYSLPNKLFEYIAAGVPVVGSSFPEIEKIVKGMGTGVTADPADPESVADALRRLLNDAALAEQCRERCRVVSQQMTWERESAALRKAFVF